MFWISSKLIPVFWKCTLQISMDILFTRFQPLTPPPPPLSPNRLSSANENYSFNDAQISQFRYESVSTVKLVEWINVTLISHLPWSSSRHYFFHPSHMLFHLLILKIFPWSLILGTAWWCHWWIVWPVFSRALPCLAWWVSWHTYSKLKLVMPLKEVKPLVFVNCQFFNFKSIPVCE